MTAQEACKEGSETCRGECTNINNTRKTGTTKANSITEWMTWRKTYFNKKKIELYFNKKIETPLKKCLFSVKSESAS